jgi:hypothetical protein
VRNRSDIINTNTTNWSKLVINPADTTSDADLFVFDFLTAVKLSASVFGSDPAYDYQYDYPIVNQIIQESYANIKTKYDSLVKETNAIVLAENDKKLRRNMVNALQEYIDVSFSSFNKTLGNTMYDCQMNVLPNTCACFNSGQPYVQVSADPATKYKVNGNEFTLNQLADVNYLKDDIDRYRSQCNAVVNGPLYKSTNNSSTSNNIIQSHTEFLTCLYSNDKLKPYLYSLFDDQSIVEYPNPDMKLSGILSQM